MIILRIASYSKAAHHGDASNANCEVVRVSWSIQGRVNRTRAPFIETTDAAFHESERFKVEPEQDGREATCEERPLSKRTYHKIQPQARSGTIQEEVRLKLVLTIYKN